jgi:molybdopterin synthase catalytic subunit
VIRVQTQPFDIAAEVAALTAGRTDIGAIVTFSGTVRGEGKGPAGARVPIRSMTLEHYPGMTEAELARIESEALARWPLQGTTIIHRVGELLPGDPIVLVVAASPHRQAAFDAAAFLMDYLKTSAPFWKKETGLDGVGHWVDARDADDAALDKWKKPGTNG